jgi:3,4-dihydroxy 2-butanone 4-phosphate synthase/GTP cyclohydrolase II
MVLCSGMPASYHVHCHCVPDLNFTATLLAVCCGFVLHVIIITPSNHSSNIVLYVLYFSMYCINVSDLLLPLRPCVVRVCCCRSLVDGAEHAALVAGPISSSSSSHSQQQQQQQPVLARVQMQQHLMDVFGALHCGQGPFLDQAMAAIAAAGSGVVLYVQGHTSSSPGKGLAAELQAFARSQEACSISSSAADAPSSNSSDALEGANRSGASSSLSVDLRDSAVAAHMLRHLGVSSVRLMSDDADEAQRMRCCGVEAELVGLPGSSSSRQQLQALLDASSNGSGSLNGAAPAGVAH